MKVNGSLQEQIRERVIKAVDDAYAAKRTEWTNAMPGQDLPQQIEKSVLLQTLDRLWREHIISNDYLRQVIHLRGYGQRDPLNEYKTEGFNLFQDMVARLREAVTGQLMRVQLQFQQPGAALPEELPDMTPLPPMDMHHVDATTGRDEGGDQQLIVGDMTMVAERPSRAKQRPAAFDPQKPETWGKVSRNDDCPCGSGKKFKHCHGAYV